MSGLIKETDLSEFLDNSSVHELIIVLGELEETKLELKKIKDKYPYSECPKKKINYVKFRKDLECLLSKSYSSFCDKYVCIEEIKNSINIILSDVISSRQENLVKGMENAIKDYLGSRNDLNCDNPYDVLSQTELYCEWNCVSIINTFEKTLKEFSEDVIDCRSCCRIVHSISEKYDFLRASFNRYISKKDAYEWLSSMDTIDEIKNFTGVDITEHKNYNKYLDFLKKED